MVTAAMKLKDHLLLRRKVMTNLGSIFKSRDITLPAKVRTVKAMVFPVVMYGCESWTVKKAECRRIDAFELWCWRRLFFFFNFILFLKLYNIVLVLPNIEMNPPQVYMCSPSWTLLPPPSPYQPSGSSQCTSPKHPVSCIEPGLATCFIHDIIHVSMPSPKSSHPLPLPQSP